MKHSLKNFVLLILALTATQIVRADEDSTNTLEATKELAVAAPTFVVKESEMLTNAGFIKQLTAVINRVAADTKDVKISLSTGDRAKRVAVNMVKLPGFPIIPFYALASIVSFATKSPTKSFLTMIAGFVITSIYTQLRQAGFVENQKNDFRKRVALLNEIYSGPLTQERKEAAALILSEYIDEARAVYISIPAPILLGLPGIINNYRVSKAQARAQKAALQNLQSRRNVGTPSVPSSMKVA